MNKSQMRYPRPMFSLSPTQQRILKAVAQGIQLRDHRDIEGGKVFQLHALDGSVMETVDAEMVHALVDLGLISSNKKFPSATYWLTSAGRAWVESQGISPTGLTAQ